MCLEGQFTNSKKTQKIHTKTPIKDFSSSTGYAAIISALRCDVKKHQGQFSEQKKVHFEKTKQWEVIVLVQLKSHIEQAHTQQHKPESPTITPPDMRYIHFERRRKKAQDENA